MEVLHVSSDDFDDVISSNEKVLVDFWADWCGPCKMLAPILTQVADETDNVIVAKVNVDDCPKLAMDFEINSIPALVLFEDGEEVNRSIGVMPKDEILDFIGE